MTSFKKPVTMRRWATETGIPRVREIEKFVLVNLTGGRAVTAFHVVSQNFETGHRVRFGVVTQEKIAHLLIGVGEMCVRFDSDEAAERAASTVVERVLIKEIAGRVWREVVLQRAGIEFLVAISDGDGKEIAAPAFADETAETFESRVPRSEMQIETHGRRVVIDRGRIHLQSAHVFAPGLRANVRDFRPGPAMRSFTPQAKPAACRSNERNDSITVTSPARLQQEANAGTRKRSPHAANGKSRSAIRFRRHAGHKGMPGRDQSLVQRGEPGRTQDRRLRHEVLSENIGVFNHGALERLKNNATLFQLIGNDVSFDELIAGEDHAGGDFIEPPRLFENRVTILVG